MPEGYTVLCILLATKLADMNTDEILADFNAFAFHLINTSFKPKIDQNKMLSLSSFIGERLRFAMILDEKMKQVIYDAPDETPEGFVIKKDIIQYVLSTVVIKNSLDDFDKRYKPEGN